jgi:hypothetical protein
MSDFDLTRRYDPDEARPASLPARPAVPESSAVPAPDPAEAAPSASADQGPVPWKAAASSVPKLREQPAPLPETPGGEGEFPGFTQDAIERPGAEPESWDQEAHGGSRRRSSPLSAELPLWEVWLERVRALPRPVVIGALAGVLVLWGVVSFVSTRAEGLVSLGRIRQHPEAYDGRVIKVRGKAGETFSVGGNYVFNLRQGRDTIVVYSRTRRPHLHETVRATGIVSIGYLDGAPRVALFEQEQEPTP